MSAKGSNQQVGGFAFTAQPKASRKRPAQEINSDDAEKAGSSAGIGISTLQRQQQTSVDTHKLAAAEYTVACLEAYRSTASATSAERVVSVVNAALLAANTHASTIDALLGEQVAAVHSDFLAHVSSELQKEAAAQQKPPLRNPKNVLNSKLKEDCERRIKGFEQEKAHWEGLHTKLHTASAGGSTSSGPAKASPGTAVREWASSRAKHGAQLSAVPSAASRALQDLDVVAEAMRKGSKAVKRAKRAVVAASKEARADAFENVGGKGGGSKDAKSIIKAMLR